MLCQYSICFLRLCICDFGKNLPNLNLAAYGTPETLTLGPWNEVTLTLDFEQKVGLDYRYLGAQFSDCSDMKTKYMYLFR